MSKLCVLCLRISRLADPHVLKYFFSGAKATIICIYGETTSALVFLSIYKLWMKRMKIIFAADLL